MTVEVAAEIVGFVSGVALAIPAVRLLALQRRISRADTLATEGKSKGVRGLAGELRDQYQKGVFGFSYFDASCVVVGLLTLLISTAMKIL